MAKEDLELAARAMMTVTAPMPGEHDDEHAYPVLGEDSNYDALPFSQADSTVDDLITRETVMKLAAAAIQAVRIPTGAMMNAGAAVIAAGHDPSNLRQTAALVYKAMIDEFLKK